MEEVWGGGDEKRVQRLMVEVESAAQAWSAIESHIMQTSEVHMALSEVWRLR